MKTKLAFQVRYSTIGGGVMAQTAGRNLRTKAAAQRGVRTMKKLGFKDVWIGSLTVTSDTILRK